MSGRQDNLESLIGLLRDDDTPVRAALVYRLSEPSEDDLNAVRNAWLSIAVERRRVIISRLAEASENDFQVDFTAVALVAAKDEDSQVRQSAVGALWVSESPEVMHLLIDHLKNDPSIDVRSASASALGKFVMLGELGEYSRREATRAEDALLQALAQNPERGEIYRRALESIAYSSRDNVIPLIKRAAQSEHVALQASALSAMGRHGDERWSKDLLKALDEAEPQLRFEAARASGEIGLSSAVSRLIELTNDADREIKEAAIWALGEIGGSEAQAALLQLAETEKEEDLLESIEDAINMASAMSGDLGMYLLPGEEDDDFDAWADDDGGDRDPDVANMQ